MIKKLLKITRINTKESYHRPGSHRCLKNILLNLSTKSQPTPSNQCHNIKHHPYKLNELYVKNIPNTFNSSQVLNIFKQYKSIKFVSFINESKQINANKRSIKTAIIQTLSGYIASQILKTMNNYEIYSHEVHKHILSIGYNRIQQCGFNYCFVTYFVYMLYYNMQTTK